MEETNDSVTQPVDIDSAPTDTSAVPSVPSDADTVSSVPSDTDTVSSVPSDTDTVSSVPSDADTVSSVPSDANTASASDGKIIMDSSSVPPLTPPPAPPQKPKPLVFAGLVLREKLRQKAMDFTQALARSVARQTSYDRMPCVEYSEEVVAEYDTIDSLLYLQNCRAALERCLEGGVARLRFRWQSGETTMTRFRKLNQGRVEVYGLQITL